MDIGNIQAKYISTSSEDERADLVARPDFPKKLFAGVVYDESSKVKIALIDNHSLGADILAKLCDDKDLSVRQRAYDKLCREAETE